MSAKGIAWPEDASQYKQSPWQTDAALASFVPTFVIPPPQWRAAWPLKYGDGYTAESLPRLDQDERFQVWMRKAGLSTFRKLWGRSKSHIEPGTYQVTITDKWDAMRFEGTKSLVFGEVGFLGPKNLFLGLSLLIVGLLCLISAIAVSTIRIRRLGDPALFSWNKLKTS